MADLYINGSSFASGWYKDHESIKITDYPSWVKHITESLKPDRVWNDALKGKSIGMTARDTVSFCEQYKEKYGSLENLIVINEYTTPRYRHWEPVSTMDNQLVYPIAHISHSSLHETEHYFVKREWDNNTLTFTNTHIPDEDIHPDVFNKWKKEMEKWYFSGWPIQYFMEYATNEILPTMKYLEENNVRHVMWWCVGRTRLGKALVQKYTRKLYTKKKFIKPTEMNGHEVAETISKEPYKGHPDTIGHKYIADYILKHAKEHNLF